MDEFAITISLGSLMGVMARAYMLRSDYRQYPGYPHGYVTHLSLGFIASALGSVAIPAIVAKEYAAVTFLALAAEQFRNIRNMERESLSALEEAELVPRGHDYIEGIARVFEARNYLVMVTALITSTVYYLFRWPLASIFVGFVSILMTSFLMRGKILSDLAEVRVGKISFEGPLLKVGNIDIMNVGLPQMREKILSDALGVEIHPKDDNARSTLHNMGQRQAIAHVATSILGTKKDVDTPEFTPMVRKDIDTGAIALYCVPAEKDIESLLFAVRKVPILESAYRKPLKTKAGRMAAD